MKRPLDVALALLLVEALLLPPGALANPRGGVVRGGAATIVGQGSSVVDVHQTSQNAVLSWEGFDIQPGEVTNFHQPGQDAVAINRILDGQASQILGNLNANGHVYLINPNGILFGRDAVVNVHALTAATSVKAGQLLALGGGLDASADAAPGARVENRGRIATGAGGFVYLVAPEVENGETGVIVSPGGEVTLAAGATVYLTDRPDGLGLAIEYTAQGAPGGEAVNLGRLVADAGLVRMRAALIRQQGTVEANAVRATQGRVELYADTSATLGAGSVTSARGGDEGPSDGGDVSVVSRGDATVAQGALVDASGGAQGGAGGDIEMSAADTARLSGTLRSEGRGGASGGGISIDPNDVEIVGAQTIEGASSVKVTANRTIALQNGATVSLSNPTGTPTYALHSGGDIVFGSGARITDAGSAGTPVDASHHWNVQLVAGATDLTPTGLGLGTQADPVAGGVYLSGGAGAVGALVPGSNDGEVSLSHGDLTLRAAGDVWIGNGGGLRNQRGEIDVVAGRDVRFRAGSTTKDGVIENGSGDIRVVAGRSVDLWGGQGVVGNAAIRTRGLEDRSNPDRITRSGGGDILVHALTGDVDAGVGNRWLSPGPDSSSNPAADVMPVVKSGILGIGSEAGGDVSVIAGGDVRTDSSVLQRTGGSAFNSRRGDGDHTGGHIGVFGQDVVDVRSGSSVTTELLPTSRESRLLVIAGGDISGDYAIRHGRAVFRAGYALSGVDASALGVASAANLAVDPRAPGAQIARSAAASADPNRGWFGPLARPVTVDVLDGRPIVDAGDPARVAILAPTVDALGANGVVLRAIETPSLVYPAGGQIRTRRVPGYSQHDSAWLEAEIGDVVLVGNDVLLPSAEPSTASSSQPAGFEENTLVRLLPPSLRVRTNAWCPGCPRERGLESRGGDLVLVNDFTLYPSARGGLTLDLAGKARTASFAALGPTTLSLDARTLGSAADLAFALPSGTLLVDPETGLRFRLQGSVAFNAREPARAAGGDVLFRARPGQADAGLAIPAGTEITDARGNVYRTVGAAEILAPALRLSEGRVTFFAQGSAAAAVGIPATTRLVASDGTVFETLEQVVLEPGMREVTAAVRAVNETANAGRDAASFDLQLAQPIAGVESATNRRATVRPAEVLVPVEAVEPGLAGNTLPHRITGIVAGIPGLESVFNPGALAGGLEQASFGSPPFGSSASVVSQRNGPVGRLSSGHLLQVVDPAVLPAGVSASDLQLRASTNGDDATLRPVVYKSLQVERDASGAIVATRSDPAAGTLASATASVWAREAATRTASLRHSDASPSFDARGIPRYTASQYAAYYRDCRSGAICGVSDPRGQAILLGTAPTHAGDRSPASLEAKGGFERVRLELAEAAELRTDGDIYDLALLAQHGAASDLTRVLAPTGSARFGAGALAIRDVDPATGAVSTVSVPDQAASGVQVSGPGKAQVLVGVVSHAEGDLDGDGFIEFSEFHGSREVFDALDREEIVPDVTDGRLSATEAPWVPTGSGGGLALQARDAAGSVLGIQTVGNLQNDALATGGAELEVVSAGDLALGSRGFIGTLQGGDLRVASVAGAITGGVPPEGTTTKRGIVTTFTGPGSAQREALPTGGGAISVQSLRDFDIAGLALAALSGSGIRIESLAGSVSAGVGQAFSRPLIAFDNEIKEVTVSYRGSGIAAPGGSVDLVAKENIDIGAGITGAGITVEAGGSVLAGTGVLASTGSISISAGQTISGNIQATGSVSISGGTVTSGSNVSSTGGLVTGAGAVASNTGSGRSSTESARAAEETQQAAFGVGTAFESERRRVVRIDVTSRPCVADECQS